MSSNYAFIFVFIPYFIGVAFSKNVAKVSGVCVCVGGGRDIKGKGRIGQIAWFDYRYRLMPEIG